VASKTPINIHKLSHQFATTAMMDTFLPAAMLDLLDPQDLFEEEVPDEAEEPKDGDAATSTRSKGWVHGKKNKPKDKDSPKVPRPCKRKHDDPSHAETVCISYLNPLLNIGTCFPSFRALIHLCSLPKGTVNVDLMLDSAEELPKLAKILTLSDVHYGAPVVCTLAANTSSLKSALPLCTLIHPFPSRIEQGWFYPFLVFHCLTFIQPSFTSRVLRLTPLTLLHKPYMNCSGPNLKQPNWIP
jgi:hypothetical protein